MEQCICQVCTGQWVYHYVDLPTPSDAGGHRRAGDADYRTTADVLGNYTFIVKKQGKGDIDVRVSEVRLPPNSQAYPCPALCLSSTCHTHLSDAWTDAQAPVKHL